MVDENKQVIEDARCVCGEPKDSKWMPPKPEELCNSILHTWLAVATIFSKAHKLTESQFFLSFMGTQNSSNDTRAWAHQLANRIQLYAYLSIISPEKSGNWT